MPKIQETAKRYVKNISINPEMSHNKILARIKENSIVLEFGPASGAMTKVLTQEMNCVVSIVEKDKECFQEVMEFVEDGICEDIENFTWTKKFKKNYFDYIILADVLEHLKEPEKVLVTSKQFLKQGGSVLISVPNIAHNTILLNLFENRFIYQNTGILDYSHIRHFTYTEILNLCKEVGLSLVYTDGVYIGVGKNEYDISYKDVDPILADILIKRPFGEVYQHILETKEKQYVEQHNIKLENCLGEPKRYSSILEKITYQEEYNIKTSNEELLEILVKNPNMFFASNNEIARLRLKINDIYNANPELEELVRIKNRIFDCEQEIKEKNHYIKQLKLEEDQNKKKINELLIDLEESNEHISTLNHEIEMFAKHSEEYTHQIIQYEKELEKAKKEIEEYIQTINKLNKFDSLLNQTKIILEEQAKTYTENKDVQIQLLEQKITACEEECKKNIKNKNEQIQLLEEKANLTETQNQNMKLELERIQHSKGWKLMQLLWKATAFLIPPNSKRRLFCKLCLMFIAHPIKSLKLITTPRKLKNFFYYLKKDGSSFVSNRIEESFLKIDNKKIEYKIDLPDQDKNDFISNYNNLTFMAEDNPQVSIIIPVYNQFSYTYNCLKSIMENTSGVSYEIIIANDCSSDLTIELLQVVKNISMITNKTNLRFLKNCNHAAKFAKGTYILFLNNDTQVQENWLQPLVNLIESKPDIGLVGSKLVYPDGKLQEAGGILWNDGSAWNYGNRQNPEKSEFNYIKEVDYISGASIMIKKSLWTMIGGFDERFTPAYCEDSDLAFEVRKLGYKVFYQPLSVVVHFEGISNGLDTNTGQKAYQVINQEKFKEKWKTVLEMEHFQNAEDVFLARDRSKNKPTLLMIDHYVPHYDKDAGSRTVFQYLKLFIDQGFNVKFIGDNFFRHEPYTTKLQQMGIEVLYGPYYANNWKNWIKNNAKYINYIFLNRPHISIKYIDFIKKYTNSKIIYYGHDLHFLRELRKYELTHDKKALADSIDWKEREFKLMNQADIVYYPSNIEVQEIKQVDKNITAKVLVPYIFDNVKEAEYVITNRQDIMFVGGFTHTPNVDAVLWMTKNIFPNILKELPNLKLYILGSNPPQEIIALSSNNVIIKGFVTDEELEYFYNHCRISIVPLRYGAGIKGKVIEAMSYGIPVVTTSVGAEGILEAENILCIEDTETNMSKKIISLYTNEKMLKMMSKSSYLYIRKYFSSENAIKVIAKDFGFGE